MQQYYYDKDTFINLNQNFIEIKDMDNIIKYRFSPSNIINTRVQTLPDTDVAYMNITVQSSNNIVKLSFIDEVNAIAAKILLDGTVTQIMELGVISQITKWDVRPDENDRVVGQIGFNITTKKMEFFDGDNWQIFNTTQN